MLVILYRGYLETSGGSEEREVSVEKGVRENDGNNNEEERDDPGGDRASPPPPPEPEPDY